MSTATRLRELLAAPEILVMPGCYDAMSARLIERAGFKTTFMGGFAVAASRIGMPDTGLISYAEMLDQGNNICSAVSIPVIGDGDTGYGNALNVQRTVRGYARAGFACVMIEDQVAPKRCGHTRGKQTVDRDEAYARVQAAVDARDAGTDILIMARTDANATEGFDEALERARKFTEIGVDITFLEAPRSEEEMRIYCENVPGPKMANMIEQGDTPVLNPKVLQEIGYSIAIYPISLMLAGIHAMEQTLAALAAGQTPDNAAEFAHLRDIVGFPEYYEAEQRYAAD
ncbi:MAG: isocitrate lyase/PEP mutase family protein [Gammaproteobacteria bacterium]|nr:isocitrate lyase/PEP mutase family protein [Gammaproteobacteria bacterium]MDX2462810.1 isocitrate lyase/PEP mutase family protein [Gammaproteobacteria bacterium]